MVCGAFPRVQRHDPLPSFPRLEPVPALAASDANERQRGKRPPGLSATASLRASAAGRGRERTVGGACALRPRFHWPHRSLGGPGVADPRVVARGGGASPRFATKIVDFILRRRALEPAQSREAVRLESELEGDSAPAREFSGPGKRPRVDLYALQTVTQVLHLRIHDLESSAGAALTAGSLRVTPNAPGVIRREDVYASFGPSASLAGPLRCLGAHGNSTSHSGCCFRGHLRRL